MGKRGRVIFYEEIKMKIKNLGYDLISKEYKDMRSKLIIKDFDGFYYMIEWRKLRDKCFPRKFHIANPYTIQNIKLWCKLNDKPFELVSETYGGSCKKLKCKCSKENCRETFEITWQCIMLGEGCPYCAGVRVCLSNCLATKNPEFASEWHPTKNGDLTPYDITINSGKYIWWICKECGYEWHVKMDSRTNQNTGCPECNKSKGEKECSRIFISNGFVKINQEDYEKLSDIDKIKYIYFIPQMKFDDLIGLGGGLLLYDFYLPNYNLFIEYDGEFHYKPIKNYKNEPMKYAEERLKKQKMHDNLKNNYAQNNNIKLLRIPYWDFDNIEEILTLNILTSNPCKYFLFII